MQCMRKPLTVFVMCENIRAYPLARQYQNTTNTTILIMTQFRTTMTAAALALAAIASVPTVQAAPIAYEGFDYNVGVLSGNNGGGGWNGAWLQNGGSINNSLVVAGGFTYTDVNGYSLVVSGNRAHITGDGSATGDNTGGTTASANPLRLLNSGRGLSGGPETTWISMLALRTGLPITPGAAPNDYLYNRAFGAQFFYQSTTATAAGNEQFSVGRATQSSETTSWANDTWSVSQQGNANGQKVSNVNFANSPADFLLIRIDHVGSTLNDAANADTLRMWINPSDLNLIPSDASADITFSANEFAGVPLSLTRDFIFNRIRLFGGGFVAGTGYGAFDLDELRIGETFGDVTPNAITVPEPAIGALAGLGLLALISRRRR